MALSLQRQEWACIEKIQETLRRKLTELSKDDFAVEEVVQSLSITLFQEFNISLIKK